MGGGARNLPDLKVGDMVQIQNQHGNNPKRWCKSGKIVERLEFNQYLVKVDGGGRLTRRNRRFLKKIVSTLADKEFVVENDDTGADVKKSARLVDRATNVKRSTRLVDRGADVRKSARLVDRGADVRKSDRLKKSGKSAGGDVRKVVIDKMEMDKKRWR